MQLASCPPPLSLSILPHESNKFDLALCKFVHQNREIFIPCVSNENVRRIAIPRPGCGKGSDGAAREGKLRVDVWFLWRPMKRAWQLERRVFKGWSPAVLATVTRFSHGPLAGHPTRRSPSQPFVSFIAESRRPRLRPRHSTTISTRSSRPRPLGPSRAPLRGTSPPKHYRIVTTVLPPDVCQSFRGHSRSIGAYFIPLANFAVPLIGQQPTHSLTVR